MRRIGDRLDAETPPTQAVHRKSRSATENGFATKMVMERTVSAKNEITHLLLLDMTKTFDSISRKSLKEDLKKIIDPDELHLMKILLDEKLSLKCDCDTSE